MYFEKFKKLCIKNNQSNYEIIEPSIPWFVSINQCEKPKDYINFSTIEADSLTYLTLKEFIEDYKDKEGLISFSNNKVLKFRVIFDDTKFKNLKDIFEKRLKECKK